MRKFLVLTTMVLVIGSVLTEWIKAAPSPDRSTARGAYYVDGSNPKAADTNAGTAAAPWKTIARAGKATELRPGDTVLIKSGVYREWMDITVSGEPGKPITFAAAKGARVVLKGSELIKGEWTKVSEDKSMKEPFPNASQNLWKIKLGDEYFTDPRFPTDWTDKSRRHVSQVFVSDRQPLQLIGSSPLFDNKDFMTLEPVGTGRNDMRYGSFFYDKDEQTLYVRIYGEPSWSWIEVGVRGFVLTVSKAHDVVVRGLEVRHNRQAAGMWPMANVSECERVTLEDCKFNFADFSGLGVGSSRSCTVRRCDLSWNGSTGLGMGKTTDCVVEDCSDMFNNYRRFAAGWHAGGMKNIASNKRTTIRRCEVAYNFESPGIWFDTDNRDIYSLRWKTHLFCCETVALSNLSRRAGSTPTQRVGVQLSHNRGFSSLTSIRILDLEADEPETCRGRPDEVAVRTKPLTLTHDAELGIPPN